MESIMLVPATIIGAGLRGVFTWYTIYGVSRTIQGVLAVRKGQTDEQIQDFLLEERTSGSQLNSMLIPLLLAPTLFGLASAAVFASLGVSDTNLMAMASFRPSVS